MAVTFLLFLKANFYTLSSKKFTVPHRLFMHTGGMSPPEAISSVHSDVSSPALSFSVVPGWRRAPAAGGVQAAFVSPLQHPDAQREPCVPLLGSRMMKARVPVRVSPSPPLPCKCPRRTAPRTSAGGPAGRARQQPVPGGTSPGCGAATVSAGKDSRGLQGWECEGGKAEGKMYKLCYFVAVCIVRATICVCSLFCCHIT